jgi:AraC-like DNA-binding protein
MRAPLKKTIKNPIDSITILDLEESYFDPNWHFHPHYQLFTVLEGKGTRLIGDNIQYFEEGDTVLIGPNMPHLWRNDKAYFESNSELKTRGIVAYFTQEFLDKACINLPEARNIRRLLADSERGVFFYGQTQTVINKKLISLVGIKGLQSVLQLLDLLDKLSYSTEFEFITSLGYRNTHKVSETERMHKVYEFAFQHYKENIKLKDVASSANMSVPAFCRYFKKRAHKTFSNFVAEIRVGHACKILSENDLSIAQICYESGFNTLSNFNKTFKDVKGQTPSEFRRELGS